MWFERIVMICHPHVALAKSAVQWSDILSEVAYLNLCICTFSHYLPKVVYFALKYKLIANSNGEGDV